MKRIQEMLDSEIKEKIEILGEIKSNDAESLIKQMQDELDLRNKKREERRAKKEQLYKDDVCSKIDAETVSNDNNNNISKYVKTCDLIGKYFKDSMNRYYHVTDFSHSNKDYVVVTVIRCEAKKNVFKKEVISNCQLPASLFNECKSIKEVTKADYEAFETKFNEHQVHSWVNIDDLYNSTWYWNPFSFSDRLFSSNIFDRLLF